MCNCISKSYIPSCIKRMLIRALTYTIDLCMPLPILTPKCIL